MKTFAQLLSDFEFAVVNTEHERLSPLRNKYPKYYEAEQRDLELARKKLLAWAHTHGEI